MPADQRQRRLLPLLSAILPLLLLPGPAARAADIWLGGDIRPYGRVDTGNAFDLHFSREYQRLRHDDNSTAELRSNTLGVGFHETLADHVRGSLRLAAVEASPRRREAIADLDPDGYHVEVDLDGAWPFARRHALGYGARWRYTRIRDDDLRMTWHTWELRAAYRARLSRGIAARLGVSAHAIDGTERFRGDQPSTSDFTSASAAGAFAQLDMRAGRSGMIRLRVRGGNPREALVSFEQRY